jgi:hypothetical protein
MCNFILSQFLMGTYILEMNKRCFNWHMPLSCEEVEFGLTHNSLFWTNFVHPFFSFFFVHPFYPSSSKNVPKHKRFERLNSDKNRLKWYKECVVSYCLNSLWEHTSWKWTGGVSVDTYLLVVKKYFFDWRNSLGCEHVLFIFFSFVLIFHPFYLFICYKISSIFHPFSFFIFGHVVEYSSTSWKIICLPCVNKIFLQKFDLTHLLMFTK